MQRIATSLLILLTLLGLGLYELNHRWRSTLAVPAGGLRFTVQSGDTLRAVAQKLNDKGVLQHPTLLRLYGRWSGLVRMQASNRANICYHSTWIWRHS